MKLSDYESADNSKQIRIIELSRSYFPCTGIRYLHNKNRFRSANKTSPEYKENKDPLLTNVLEKLNVLRKAPHLIGAWKLLSISILTRDKRYICKSGDAL